MQVPARKTEDVTPGLKYLDYDHRGTFSMITSSLPRAGLLQYCRKQLGSVLVPSAMSLESMDE